MKLKISIVSSITFLTSIWTSLEFLFCCELHISLKGQCHEIFNLLFQLFGLKHPTWAPYKQFGELFRFDFAFPRRRWQHGLGVSVVNAQCRRRHWLSWHGVSVIVDYADSVSAYDFWQRTDVNRTAAQLYQSCSLQTVRKSAPLSFL